MLTDAPSRKNRAGFLESDRITTLDLQGGRGQRYDGGSREPLRFSTDSRS
jgi:hypothetical protein